MAWSAAGTMISRPYQGFASWWVEATYGNDTPKSAASEIADCVGSARFETGEVNKYYRSIDSYKISKATETLIDYTFHLEYHVQYDDELAKYLFLRGADDNVRSLGFEIGMNTGSAAYDSFFILKGCKCKNAELNGSEGEGWNVTADFSVRDITITDTQNSTVTTTVTGDLCMFNVAGNIQADAADIAYAVNNFTVRVSHGIDDIWTVGSRLKKAAIGTAMDITGSCDISMDDGGGNHINDVIGSAEATSIVIDLGTGGSLRFTLSNARFDSGMIETAGRSEGVIEGCPFTCRDIAITAVP